MAAGAWSWHSSSFGYVCNAPWCQGPWTLLFCLQQLHSGFTESPTAAFKEGRRLCDKATSYLPC